MSINHHARNAAAARAGSLSFRGLVQRASALLCLLLALMLLVIGKIYPEWMQQLRLSTTTYITEAASILGRPLDSIRAAQQSLGEWQGAVEENRRLRLELEAYVHTKAQLQEMIAENTQLRALTDVATIERPLFITARIISLAGGNTQQSVWLNVGALHSIEKNMAVMAPEGVIGRVVEVGDHRSRVLLMTDALSRMPVQMGLTRFHAIAAGQEGSGLLSLRHLPMHAQLQPGELVLTAGDGQLLPVGIPVGVVEAVPGSTNAGKEMAPSWRVRPLADLSRLDTVSVIQLPQ